MAARRSAPPRQSKPTLDAVNDAVAALFDLVRSLRSSAKSTSARAKRAAKEAKVTTEAKVKRATRKTGAKVRSVGQRITKGLERAWEVLKDVSSGPPAKPRKAARGAKGAVST